MYYSNYGCKWVGIQMEPAALHILGLGLLLIFLERARVDLGFVDVTGAASYVYNIYLLLKV